MSDTVGVGHLVGATAVVLVLAGCGGHHAAAGCTLSPAAAPVPETGEHSVAARSSCALPARPRIVLLGSHGRRLGFTYVLEHAIAPACAAAIAGIAKGAPRFAVEESLGKPDTAGPRCPVWRWKPERGSIDGARICFAHGRATRVGTAVHG